MLKKLFSIKDSVREFTENNKNINHIEVDLKELQSCLLDMYSDIVSFCEQNDLTIFAVGGTALGSVRHSGFIPWDDDIDLGMLREDYQKFITLFDNSSLSEEYILKCPGYSEKNPNRFLQIYNKNTILKTLHNESIPDWQMVFLDIFPYDAVSNNKYIRLQKGIGSDLLMLIASCVGLVENKNEKTKAIFYSSKAGCLNYVIRYIIGTIFSFKSQSEWFDIIDKFIRNENKQSKYLTSAMGSKHYLGEVIERSIFIPTRKGIFATLSINLPGRVEEYLNMLYGNNYMEIPKNKYTHSVTFFKRLDK